MTSLLRVVVKDFGLMTTLQVRALEEETLALVKTQMDNRLRIQAKVKVVLVATEV